MLLFDHAYTVPRTLPSGALLALAATEALVVAAVLALIGQPQATAVVIGLLILVGVLARGLGRAGRTAARARAAVTEHFAGRLLALRTVTIQEDPETERRLRDNLLTELEAGHARVDRRRVLLSAVLPRAGALALLGVVALDPPGGTGETAGVFGAVLVLFGALERIGQALSDLVPGLAATAAARTLLTDAGPPADDSPPLVRVPAARPGHMLHQPLAANAVLGTGTWPPTDQQLDALEETLRSLALDDVVERMPMGLGQPLGDTGWRLSQGEQARIVVARALLGRGDQLEIEDALTALDPSTAHRVLDALDADPRPTRLT